jgi:excisionase family DNA binding protein
MTRAPNVELTNNAEISSLFDSYISVHCEMVMANTKWSRRTMSKNPLATSPTPRRALTVTEFCESFRVCRSTAYNLISRGELHTVKLGRRRLVPVDVAEALLRPEATPSSAQA